MVNEELRAKLIARAKLKIERAKPLAILEAVTLLEYIEEIEAAQQGVQRTADKRCEKHSVVYCAECYPATGVKSSRR